MKSNATIGIVWALLDKNFALIGLKKSYYRGRVKINRKNPNHR